MPAPPRGQCAIGPVLRNHGTPTTLITALSPDGIQAALAVPGAVDQLAFRVFVPDIPGPTFLRT